MIAINSFLLQHFGCSSHKIVGLLATQNTNAGIRMKGKEQPNTYTFAIIIVIVIVIIIHKT